MKPTRYEALRQAVDETFDISPEQWDSIDQRVEDIRSR
jgi:hypothetical protein